LDAELALAALALITCVALSVRLVTRTAVARARRVRTRK
jgi:hypothetical protein